MARGTAAKRITVLISGRGSNMLSIADAIDKGQINAHISCVISNRKDAKGLDAASARGLSTEVIQRGDFADREAFEESLLEVVQGEQPDWILLAGFMHILGERFVAQFEHQIINIHPSLLPAYKGLDTHRRVLEAKEQYHGCSVHYVTAELDAGELIGQKVVSVEPDDTPETLAARVLKEEHILYPQCVAELCKD